MTIQEIIHKDLVKSMKSRDSLKVAVLRGIKSNFKNREIELRHSLSMEESLSVLFSLIKQRRDSIEQFNQGNRNDLVAKEEAELKILQSYVPEAVDHKEIEAVVCRSIDNLKTDSIRDFGKIMKTVMSEFSGKNVDGKIVSSVVKKHLTV